MAPPLALILTYHSISSGPPPLCISPRRFEEHLDLFAAAGYEGVSLDRLVDGLEDAEALPERSFSLTFDDGYRDFVTTALPILERRGLGATLFVTAADDRTGLAVGAAGPLVELEALGELAERGVEIGAHSVSHPDLTALGDGELDDELRRSREILERHAGRPVRHFAYPFGYHDARVREAARALYRTASTTRLAAIEPDDDRLSLPRLDAYYLRSARLRFLLRRGRGRLDLRWRRWLRLVRGTERSV